MPRQARKYLHLEPGHDLAVPRLHEELLQVRLEGGAGLEDHPAEALEDDDLDLASVPHDAHGGLAELVTSVNAAEANGEVELNNGQGDGGVG